MVEKKEGATNICNACGETTVCRMTTYKDFPNKLQWQNHGDTKAHYTAKGLCKTAAPDTERVEKLATQIHSSATSTGSDLPKGNDPTPEQFLDLGLSLIGLKGGELDGKLDSINSEINHKIAVYLIQRARIEKAMNDLGLQHPSRIAFIKDVLS